MASVKIYLKLLSLKFKKEIGFLLYIESIKIC